AEPQPRKAAGRQGRRGKVTAPRIDALIKRHQNVSCQGALPDAEPTFLHQINASGADKQTVIAGPPE
ncbi:MAG TPA: hypothetical protein VL987_17115, partial [Cellvibrio sp.]|nr:hypothetical protein [Cellvibrio sp.]